MNKIFAPIGKYQDTRDAFFEELYQIALKDKDVILLMADQGALSFKKYKEKIPNQLLNAGIAEQNMISVAAGLALSGKKVFVHAIANFTTLRCYEQVKVDLSIMNLPVTIVGVGAGLTYGSDGPTHHANQDIAAMRAIPNIRILNASDNVSLSVFPHIAYQVPKLSYIRFDKISANIYTRKHNFSEGLFEITKGTNVVILTTGIMVHQALKIANNFKPKVGVIDIYQLKPLNEKKLHELLLSYNKIVVLEEHISYGGLSSIIADFIADYSISKKFLRIGLPDAHYFAYGDRDYMHMQFGISYDHILKRVEGLLKSK